MVRIGTYQPDLFAQGEPSIPTSAALVRLDLDDSSWIDLARGWLSGADELLCRLAADLPWSRGRRPMYGALVEDPRLGAGIELGRAETPSVVDDIAHWLTHRYGEAFDSVWVNYYRDGNDSVAWHSDRIGRTQVNPLVAIVSLGGPRRFRLRPRGGGAGQGFLLASGDLLVMGGACQHRWEHSIPKASAAPPRMSVTIRCREVAPPWSATHGAAAPGLFTADAGPAPRSARTRISPRTP